MNRKRRVIFTMKNEGFALDCAQYGKALLIIVMFTEAGCVADLIVLGIPLVAIKTLSSNGVYLFHRDQVPEGILDMVNEYGRRQLDTAVQGLNLGEDEPVARKPVQ